MKLFLTTRQLFSSVFCLIGCLFASVVFAQNIKLESYTYIGEFSKEKAKLTFQKIPPLETLEAKYSLNLYKILYKTTSPGGKSTTASGLVALPVAPEKPVAIVSYFHGTRVNRDDVPSRNDEKNYIYPSVFGSNGGFMLVMPDYLGLGDNDLPLHPYVQADSLAVSSIDMLIAAKELASSLNYPINNKLFLAGYSEGGFTTMVTYESLLKKHNEIPVTAVAPGSAPYDWNETLHFIVDVPGPRATVYLAYFFYSLQTYSHYWSGLDAIFKKPYETLIPSLYDGTHKSEEIIQALPATPRDIINDAVLDEIIKGNGKIAEILKKNLNHYDFKSTAPLLLIGTKGDHDVPYHGSEIAFERLSKLSDTVYIKSISDTLDHLQAFPFVTKEQLEFFKKYE